MKRKLIVLTTLLAMLAISPAALAQSTPKLGIVDLQRALNEVSEGKKAKANLESRMETEKRRRDLEAMQESLEDPMLSEEALTEKRTEYQTKAYEFQQMVVTSQQEMTYLEQNLTSDILEKLYKVAQGIAAEGGYNLIVEATAVVYVNGTTDITPQVIARYNAKK